MGRLIPRSTYTFTVVSDVREFGLTEDGEPFTGEVFYVIGEAMDGSRIRHNRNFPGVAPEIIYHSGYPDGVHYRDVRPAAKATAEKLLACVLQAKEINTEHWLEATPVYGSVAYVKAGPYTDREDE